ncbi:TetR/AcrR family transcriptional regulator [Mucilaginibacter agri]|uniref:TetR family transcriptional regulator n=1 Tax=Mucilaginibacter agri TaxID=2695265 RepID=A0A965ZIA0_9SPHI|nr:TetR/AcrR family transcriptional regulator [Mucilaginibacter agri]NCD70201.1 TetR family transcriptional regulator [Mucilaginibacter agri]
MMSSTVEISTEDKIKAAAKAVFTRKGFAATTVRDISAEADINLSLVNYYFRSKEKLFELIMTETVQQLFDQIQPVVNNPSTTLSEKIELLVRHYIDMISQNLDFPLFMVNEVMSGAIQSSMVTNILNMQKSVFAKQILDLKAEGNFDFDHVHIMMNIMSMTIFPFFSREVVIKSNTIDNEQFNRLIEDRKRLIPIWIKQMLGIQ